MNKNQNNKSEVKKIFYTCEIQKIVFTTKDMISTSGFKGELDEWPEE